jgi:hypothetical protein
LATALSQSSFVDASYGRLRRMTLASRCENALASAGSSPSKIRASSSRRWAASSRRVCSASPRSARATMRSWRGLISRIGFAADPNCPARARSRSSSRSMPVSGSTRRAALSVSSILPRSCARLCRMQRPWLACRSPPRPWLSRLRGRNPDRPCQVVIWAAAWVAWTSKSCSYHPTGKASDHSGASFIGAEANVRAPRDLDERVPARPQVRRHAPRTITSKWSIEFDPSC